MASERLRLYGCKVVAGDLVLMGNDKQGTRDKVGNIIHGSYYLRMLSAKRISLRHNWKGRVPIIATPKFALHKIFILENSGILPLFAFNFCSYDR